MIELTDKTRGFVYCRLSRDEDSEHESLKNQEDTQVKSPFRCSEKSRHFGSKVMTVDYRQYNTFEQVKVS